MTRSRTKGVRPLLFWVLRLFLRVALLLEVALDGVALDHEDDFLRDVRRKVAHPLHVVVCPKRRRRENAGRRIPPCAKTLRRLYYLFCVTFT